MLVYCPGDQLRANRQRCTCIRSGYWSEESLFPFSISNGVHSAIDCSSSSLSNGHISGCAVRGLTLEVSSTVSGRTAVSKSPPQQKSTDTRNMMSCGLTAASWKATPQLNRCCVREEQAVRDCPSLLCAFLQRYPFCLLCKSSSFQLLCTVSSTILQARSGA